MPNSSPMAVTTVPALCSPSASNSRIRRLTGSPRTSKACMTAPMVKPSAYIRQDESSNLRKPTERRRRRAVDVAVVDMVKQLHDGVEVLAAPGAGGMALGRLGEAGDSVDPVEAVEAADRLHLELPRRGLRLRICLRPRTRHRERTLFLRLIRRGGP